MSYQRARELIIEAVDELGGARRLVALAAVAAAAAVLLLWSAGIVRPPGEGDAIVLGGGPGVAPDASGPGASTAGPGAAEAATAAAQEASAHIVVHVTGAVRRPGLVRLEGGARVADAVAAAGGFGAKADQEAVNLAERVVDCQQVHVPRKGEVPGPTGGSSPPGGGVAAAPPGSGSGAQAVAVDLNSATVEQLDALPGIGPVLAQRIVDHRTQRGRFSSVDELGEVEGIGPKKLASLKEVVTVR